MTLKIYFTSPRLESFSINGKPHLIKSFQVGTLWSEPTAKNGKMESIYELSKHIRRYSMREPLNIIVIP